MLCCSGIAQSGPQGATAPKDDGAPWAYGFGAAEPWWPFSILAASLLVALGTREFSLRKNFLALCRARLSFRCQAGEGQEGQGVIVEKVLR